MPEAARVGDCHGCLAMSPLPHVGGPILKPCSMDVSTNGRQQARTGDKCLCLLANAQDFIVTGSATVTVNGQLAVREGDRAMHARGPVLSGSSTVLIGGPTAGATLGNTKAGDAACKAAAATRKNGKAGQSYNNCGVESARQLINQTRTTPLSEKELFDWATTTAPNSSSHTTLAAKEATDFASGGTWVETQEEILERNGVPAHLEDANLSNLTQTLAEKRGAIIDLDAAYLWPTTYYPPGAPAMQPGALHAVTATGAEYNANGELVAVVINDTGTGQCSVRVPVDTLSKAMDGHYAGKIVTTDNPIW